MTYEGQQCQLPLQIVQGTGPALVGRNWLRAIKRNWVIVKVASDLDIILAKHKQVFNEELGTTKGTKAKLCLKLGSSPTFFKPRPVPHALKGAIAQELDHMESMGILEKVQYSEFSSPIVPVVNQLEFVETIK